MNVKTSHNLWTSTTKNICSFSPRAVGHLMGAVVHAHQRLLVIDAGQHQDHTRVGNNQVQVVLGEVKVDRLKSEIPILATDVLYIHFDPLLTAFPIPQRIDYWWLPSNWEYILPLLMRNLSIKRPAKWIELKYLIFPLGTSLRLKCVKISQAYCQPIVHTDKHT